MGVEAAKKILATGSMAQKRYLFSFDRSTPPELVLKKYKLWSRYFFPKFFQSKRAPFHDDMDLRRIRLYLGYGEDAFLNIAFRGSAKTTGAKVFRAFAIANDTEHSRRYMRILSKDLGNAKQSVTDIYNMLNSRRVKALYPEIFQKTDAKREETMASFITATGIKVSADSIGVEQRGALQEEARPDFDWYDDFETRLSLMSAAITHKIWANMEEARTGLAKGGVSEYTCNYISERGNVHKLVQKISNKLIVPIVEGKKPTWDARYTLEDIAAIKAKAEDYEGEYLCKPAAGKDIYFDRETVDRQVATPPIDEIAGLKIFKRYNPANRVVGASDVGGGVGLDSSTAVYIDLDCIPAQVIATYSNNEVKPDAHAHVLARQGKRFGECYLAVEKNYGSTNDILKGIYPTAQLHKTQRSEGKIKYAVALEYGWDTNSATKPMMFAGLAKAIEDGLLDLNDEALIAEVRSYTAGDLMDPEVDPRLTTRHFDLLMALAIAWAVRDKVKHKTAHRRDLWAPRADSPEPPNLAR